MKNARSPYKIESNKTTLENKLFNEYDVIMMLKIPESDIIKNHIEKISYKDDPINRSIKLTNEILKMANRGY
jgi:hypothetical protein